MTNSGKWKLAGSATISADGMSVVSDKGYGLPSFCGVCGLFAARYDPLPTGSPTSPSNCKAGNPVELFSGYETPTYGALQCGCVTPRELGLAYCPVDAPGRSGVGQGWVLDYDIVLADSNQAPESKRLLLPPNGRASGDPRFDGAVFSRWNSQDWELVLSN
jgi:hypothetical protein